MFTLKEKILLALKGFGMGSANVVPGVSGGTIALLTGIYSRLIDAIDALSVPANYKLLFSGKIKDFIKKIDGAFLLWLTIGLLASVFSLAKLMEYLIIYHPVQTWAFFFGLIIASAIYMLAEIKNWTFKDALIVLVGIALGVAVCTLSPTKTPDNLWFVFLSGAIAICAMILPGISGSFLLVILGKYEFIMRSIYTFDIPVLLAFGLGCVTGIVAFAKFLHWLLGKWERATLLTLIGFVFGSLIKVWPWNDMEAVTKATLLGQGMTVEQAEAGLQAFLEAGVKLNSVADMHMNAAIVWALAGLLVVWLLETLSKKISSSHAA